MSRLTRALLLGLAIGASFYLLLIDSRSLPELYVLAGVSLIAAVTFALGRTRGGAEAFVAARWWIRSWRAIVGAPRQIARVGVEALRPARARGARRGVLRAVPFRGGRAPGDLGRHALTEWLGSFAPNTIVIGVDRERELLLVHQLEREGGRDGLDVLGLG